MIVCSCPQFPTPKLSREEGGSKDAYRIAEVGLVTEKHMTKKAFLSRLGANIRALRHGRRLTQAGLAKEIGIHPRYLQKIELDGMNASFKVLLELKRFFRCKWADLFQGIS
jgi:DNA-binding XRE family transcriptional regulator